MNKERQENNRPRNNRGQYHPKPGNDSHGRLSGKLERIKIKGFKSLQDVEIELKAINILIGANAAGKSNFLRVFDMLGWMTRGVSLQEFIAFKGGADDLLFNGSNTTRSIECELEFSSQTGINEYNFSLQYAENNSLKFSQEEYRFTRTGNNPPQWTTLGLGHSEAKITDRIYQDITSKIMLRMLQNCTIYQFHDTSDTSPLKQNANVEDKVFLKSNGINLPAILFELKENQPKTYRRIINTIRMVLPNFGDFQLKPLYNKITLNWTQKENVNKTFAPHLTSDGTLRFFALVTLLSMPIDRISDIILLDEPELGLHPYAVTVLAGMMKKLAAQNKQIIVATQSPLLIDEFEIENVIVAELEGNATQLKRLEKAKLEDWLADFSSGELWQKNIFGGNP